MAVTSLAIVIGLVGLQGCSVDSKGFGNDDAGSGGGGSGGSGGVKGSGGTTGSGGVAGEPGGSGGTLGTGGMASSGGTKGGGGASNSGGTKGTGGATSTGGSVSGGAGGGGGTGAGAGGSTGGTKGGGGGHGGQPMDTPTCDDLVSAYGKAYTEARTCTPGAVNQCQALASANLSSCPGCQQYVNDATTLTAIRAQWTSQDCAKPVLCPAIACVLPKESTCVATDAAAPGGVCSSTGQIVAN